MHPTIFGHRPFLLLLTTAVLVGWWVPLRLARRAGYSPSRVFLYLVALGLAAGLGAKLFSILERGPFPVAGDELTGGFRYPGGVVALLVAAPLLRFLLPRGLAFPRFLDFMAPGVALAAAVMRVDCLLAGCCTGAVCTLPWCLAFPRSSPAWNLHLEAGLIDGSQAHSLAVHPLQLYFLAASLAVGVWLYRFEARSQFDGQVFLWFLLLHEGGKFALETMRVPPEPAVRVVSLVLATLGAAGLLVKRGANRRVGSSLSVPSTPASAGTP